MRHPAHHDPGRRPRPLHRLLHRACSGMKLLRRKDYPDGKFTLAFVGYGDESRARGDRAHAQLGHEDVRPRQRLRPHRARGADAYKACEEVKAQGRQGHARAGPDEARRQRDRLRRGPGRLQDRVHPAAVRAIAVPELGRPAASASATNSATDSVSPRRRGSMPARAKADSSQRRPAPRCASVLRRCENAAGDDPREQRLVAGAQSIGAERHHAHDGGIDLRRRREGTRRHLQRAFPSRSGTAASPTGARSPACRARPPCGPRLPSAA